LSFFVLSSLASLLFSFGFMLSRADLRFILLASSVGNNGWFFLSSLCSIKLFVSYLLLYSFFLLLVVSQFGLSFSSPSVHSGFTSFPLYSSFVLLSGFPPFPLFFTKLLVVYYSSFYLSPHYIFLFIAFSSLLLAGYFRFLLSSFVSFLSHSVSH
jgi:hypothetical protein